MSFFFVFFKVLLLRRISCRVFFVWRGLFFFFVGVFFEVYFFGLVFVVFFCGFFVVLVVEVLSVVWGNFRFFVLVVLVWFTAGFVLADVFFYFFFFFDFSFVVGRGIRN